MPILAITPSHFTARQLKSSWGVNDVLVSSSTDIDDLVHQGIEHLRADGTVKSGDYVVVMAGSDDGGLSTTDTVRMVAVK
jgi:pyruvate kinase